MTPGDWITIGVVTVGFALNVCVYASVIKSKVAVLESRVDGIEANDIPHLQANDSKLFERLDERPCAAHEVRLENVCQRLETFEKRLNKAMNSGAANA